MEKLISAIIIILNMFFLNHSLASSGQCQQYLNGKFEIEAKPMLAVIVEISKNQIVLALGPFFTSTHESMLFSLVSEKRYKVLNVFWAGEVLVSRTKDNKIVIHRSNETSRLITLVRLKAVGLESRGSFDEVPAFLNDVQFLKGDTRQLHRFAKMGVVSLSNTYSHESSFLRQIRIVDLDADLSLDAIFVLKNQVSNLIMAMHAQFQRNSVTGDLERYREIFKTFRNYIFEFMRFTQIEDPQVLKNFNRYMLLANTVLQNGISLNNLNTDEVKELHDLMLFVSRHGLHSTSPQILHEFKIFKR